MRNKGSGFLQHILGFLASVTKAKALALKSKTNALKARLLLLSLLRNRPLVVDSISHKLRNLLGPRQPGGSRGDGDGDGDGAVVVYADGMARELARGEEEDKYPDLAQSLSELEDLEDRGGSVIDQVKNSKQEGEDFVLENEIDRVADLFIRRFYRQIMMQKQLSLKRFNEALDRSP
ncbi:hypothetical protein EUGRSUZ_I01568 [Eucalyptus grandis]|uniref:Uncharacterized protein n=2 Tax=Eucalyptus grandis TaxID=71139 RepID=A0A059APV7_EUCGR|nr:hypothetical protein EUGRSUZ_I01568 [Eucalyptus grandis]